MKPLACFVAALLVLGGFSAVAADPSAATETAVAGTESDTAPAFGGDELRAGEEFGGDSLGSISDLLVLLEITAAGESLTLTAIVALDPEAVLQGEGITANDDEYYLTDHLGSTRKVLDTATPPAVTFTAEYAPFGEAYNVAGSERFRFTGEQFDDPTGFTHLRARQYDPETGRFTGADPVLGSMSAPQTQNRYAYVTNNPGRYTDPSGEFINLIAAAFGAVIGGIIGYGACVWQTGGWTSDQCAQAGFAGMAVGALAGLTFGAGLALIGPTTTVLGTFGAVTVSGAAAGAVGGSVGYLADSLVYGYTPTLEGLAMATATGAVGGAAFAAAGFTAGRLWSGFRGPRPISQSTPPGGETRSVWSYRGNTVRVNTGHGMTSPGVAAEHGFVGTGLTPNQVESAIVRNAVGQMERGGLVLGQPRVGLGPVGVQGYQIGYNGVWLQPRYFAVSTYYTI